MKKLIILSAIAMGAVFYTNNVSAQISIHLGVNIPVHRVYVPAPRPVVVEKAPVYDDADYSDDYYYLPEVEAYYSVPNHCYYYNNGSTWISAAYLPGAYRNYNWRNAVRYEVRASRPYLHHDVYRSRWGGYTGDRNNWGHRFDNRYNGGYTYQNHDNRDWKRGNQNHDNHNWGNGNQNHDNHNWGSQHSDNHNNGGRDHDNHNNERFVQNRTGYGVRH